MSDSWFQVNNGLDDLDFLDDVSAEEIHLDDNPITKLECNDCPGTVTKGGPGDRRTKSKGLQYPVQGTGLSYWPRSQGGPGVPNSPRAPRVCSVLVRPLVASGDPCHSEGVMRCVPV